MSMQQDLQFLLGEGWRLIDANTIESPDGMVLTGNIEKAARFWRAKKHAQSLIQEKRHLTKKTFWSRLLGLVMI